MLSIPRELIQHEINKYLVEIDRQILRKVCTLFSSLFQHKSIQFNDTDLELVHIKRYLAKARTVETMNKIAFKGDLESIKYLRSPDLGEQCPWNYNTTAKAALGGNLECLRYLRENGCPWDSYTTAWAAKGGHLLMLKYAHEKGCEWDSDTTAWAASKGHLECLEYARFPSERPGDDGVPCDWDWRTPALAAKNGHLECLKYAHSHGS